MYNINLIKILWIAEKPGNLNDCRKDRLGLFLQILITKCAVRIIFYVVGLNYKCKQTDEYIIGFYEGQCRNGLSDVWALFYGSRQLDRFALY